MAAPQHHPNFAQLADAYRRLLRAALSVNDSLRRDVDHAVFTGSTEQVDNLREAVNEHLHDWSGFIYPRAPDQRPEHKLRQPREATMGPTETELTSHFWPIIIACLRHGTPVLGAYPCAMRWPGLFQ